MFEALKYSSKLFSRWLGYFPITETFSVFKIKVIILKTCVINSCINYRILEYGLGLFIIPFSYYSHKEPKVELITCL